MVVLVAYDGRNYKIMPKSLAEKPEALTYEQCKDIIAKAPEPKTRMRRTRTAKK